MTTERIKIKEKGPELYPGGSIEKFIKYLQTLKQKGWETIDNEYNYSYDGKEYYVYRTRFETDEEYAKRMELEADRKNQRRKQYEQLKKEFGD